MLIEFTVGNYLSFKDKKTLSLEATAIKEHPENVIPAGKYKLLRSVALYGANSSGKSNLLKAFEKMQDIINKSFNASSTDEIDVTPFLLSTDTEKKTSFFEILFLIDDIRYRYGFEVDRKKIHSEWLFELKTGKEKYLFIRDNDSIDVNDVFKEGKGLEDRARDNALFLAVVDQYNGNISNLIMSWFENQFFISGLKHEKNRTLTSSCLSDTTIIKEKLKKIFSLLNLGFEDISILNTDNNEKSVATFHNKYDNKGNIVGQCEFQLTKHESSGTNKLYDIAGHVITGLILGRMAIIDELDAKLHPLLTLAIIKLYNDLEYNRSNAQLIFTTHDTNLLSYGNFRRDQIYFTEKDRFEATDLYSLVEYREPDGTKIRNDRSFEKDYIDGRYGAIPFIGDFSKLFSDGTKSEN